ncbi:hypothetical protein Tco_0684991 [Tanacetum coccineum]
MTYSIASPTLDSAGSYVMQGAPFTYMVERMNSNPGLGHSSVKFPVFATGVPVGPVFLLGLLALAIVAACAFRAEEMPSVISCWMEAKVMAVEEEDGEWIRFLGGSSSSGTKKYQGSNSSDGGNTGDGVKIVGGVIGSGDEIEFSEELKDLLPAEAGK